MKTLQVLRSGIDPSVNVVEETPTGFFEARYVRLCADYFVAYLSSHDGCNRGCAMCHLTATKQTSFRPADALCFADQADRVFDEYDAAVAGGALDRWGIVAEVNLVRYNPAGVGLGAEPDEATIQRYANQLRRGLGSKQRVKVVDRVGRDVYASCGTFVGGEARS